MPLPICNYLRDSTGTKQNAPPRKCHHLCDCTSYRPPSRSTEDLSILVCPRCDIDMVAHIIQSLHSEHALKLRRRDSNLGVLQVTVRGIAFAHDTTTTPPIPNIKIAPMAIWTMPLPEACKMSALLSLWLLRRTKMPGTARPRLT